MSISPKAVHTTPAAVITHTVATLSGAQTGDITISYARTTDARITVALSGGILIGLYSADAAHGLLEALYAAGGHITTIPTDLPTPAAEDSEPPATRTTLAVEWTRRSPYAAQHRSVENPLKTGLVHWIDLYTGPLTLRFRDQTALRSTTDIFTDVHHSATAIFLDGPQHATPPATPRPAAA